jgi:hypothetical protein
MAIEKDRPAARCPAGVDVSPAVADEERTGEVDTVTLLRLDYQAGRRLAALAAVAIVVGADEEVVERQGLPHDVVHRLNGAERLRTASDVGLIGDYQQQESEFFQASEAAGGVFRDFQFRDRRRRVRLTVTHDRAIQDPIAIEENGAGGRIRCPTQGRTDSHFVSACFNAG